MACADDRSQFDLQIATTVVAFRDFRGQTSSRIDPVCADTDAEALKTR